MAASDTIATLSERVARLEAVERSRAEAPVTQRDADRAEQATKIAAIEATLPFLATKADIGEVKTEVEVVRTEISDSKNSMLRWFVGTALTIMALLITLFGVVIGLLVTRLP